jgi:ATP-dependent exoDNAse (exonuclease V) beta subunit
VLNENNRNEIAQFHDTTIGEFVKIKEKLLQLNHDLEQETMTGAAAILEQINSNGIDSKSFSGAYFPKHLLSIHEGNFNPKNKTYHEFEDIKINKTAKDRAIIEALLPEFLSQLAAIYKIFEKINFYKAFLKNITPLSLLNTVSNELSKIQEEQNVLSIAEFNAIIHREIQNQPAPFIYERLGERYRHFFIDEFQDTSEMQWQNLIPLIDNALAGQDDYGVKGTLMIVGDPKQSIYRWRGGKAEQFIALSKDHNPFSNPDKKLIHLDKNYRSYSEVIDFNNAFFKMLSAEFTNEDYKDLYENHSHQKSNDKTGGYVNISFIPQSVTNEEEEETLDKTELYVLATLQAIQKVIAQGFEYKDIVILTRKREQGIAVANYLTEQNIPLLSSETLMIQNATEVRFLIHLLKYLNNSNDLEAKVNFLYFIAKNKQDVVAVPDCIAQGMALSNEADFESWLQQLFGVQFSFQDIRKKALYEAVEISIAKFLTAVNSNSYVQYFLDIVLERDIRNQAGIADFLLFWEKNGSKFSIPSPEGSNAVRIMTIHKSKGLEFPVVIMPFAEEDYSRKPKDKLWLDAEKEELGLEKVLVDNSIAVEGFGAEASLVYNQKKEEELLDNINVLYVALTRAEEQLYIISNMNLSNKGALPKNNMCTFFINYLESKNQFDSEKLTYDFGSATKLSKSVKHIDSTKSIPVMEAFLDPKNIKIAQKEALMWGTQQQEAIAYGNVVHEILSLVKYQKDIEKAVEIALANGWIHFEQTATVTQTIQAIVSHPELEGYFEEGNQVFNEQAIIQKEGKTMKPDRMVLKGGNEMLLLDYKTGVHNVKYQQQLENYQDAIEKMGYKVVKKVLVYIGLAIDIVNLS